MDGRTRSGQCHSNNQKCMNLLSTHPSIPGQTSPKVAYLSLFLFPLFPLFTWMLRHSIKINKKKDKQQKKRAKTIIRICLCLCLLPFALSFAIFVVVSLSLSLPLCLCLCLFVFVFVFVSLSLCLCLLSLSVYVTWASILAISISGTIVSPPSLETVSMFRVVLSNCARRDTNSSSLALSWEDASSN